MVELRPGGSANCAGAMYYGIHSADQPKETLTVFKVALYPFGGNTGRSFGS
jgi:hypothetical protein